MAGCVGALVVGVHTLQRGATEDPRSVSEDVMKWQMM